VGMMEKNSLDIEKAWRSFEKTRDPALKDKLILHYVYLVKYVAGRLTMHIGSHVEFEDMISYGIFGLIDAIEKFDFNKGVKFETYASLRIRGSILDSLRKLDWVPRTLRQRNKQLEAAYTELEAALGREPEDFEIAEKMQIPVEEVSDLVRKSSIASVVSLDEYLEVNYETAFTNAKNQDNYNPEREYEKNELKKTLADAISKLSDKEKKVVTLYYFEELTLKEISVIMGVTESRISQIHSKAVLKLKLKLEKYKSLLFL
jgi:RNA polymerase sigma factor for flagellar operon FliA